MRILQFRQQHFVCVDQFMMMKMRARLRVVYVDSRLYILERNFFRNKTRSTYVQTLNTALIFMYEQPHIR